MDDSIINIDDESDSFSLSSDTDIRNIVDQWKRNHGTTDQKDLKYVDTRTFTRPKKKLFSCPDVNSTYSERREKTSYDDLAEEATTSSSGTAVPKIDLKIGGLVTSLQRSMLGDVSPPSNMDNSMGNSLITSNDFSNIDFINDTGDSLSMANFKEYRLSDAINDRNFLERLTNYDESLFTKDADINNVDLNENGNCTGSSTSTLQNSADSTTLSGKHDGTFVAPTKEMINGTFDATGEVDKTFIQAPAADISVKNNTFELGVNINQTFEAKPTVVNTTVDIVPQKLLQDENLSLCDSFNAMIDSDQRKSDGVANLTNQFIEIGSPRLNLNSTFQLDEYQSTPAAQKIRKSRKSDTLATISPIFSEKHNTNNLTKNVDKFVDIEIEEMEDVFLRDSAPKSTTRASNITGVDTELREKERQSLAKFEEFENTLLILENNKSEEEFDDLLNSFSANIRNPISDKVRQSLDNIKKRHSLIGVEKQQQDELNREKTMNISKNGKYSDYGAQEKNRMNDSVGRIAMTTSMSSSGSGERLLRRSRLFDDVITDRLLDIGDGYPTMVIDNRQTVELNTTQNLNRKNQQHLEKEPTPKTDQTTMYNTDEAGTETKTSNRDRFKTIRIFKKPPENAVQVPDVDEQYSNDIQTPMPTPRTADIFATKNTNSPKQTQLNDDQNPDTKRAINTMTYKRSGLARPRQISGLVKRDLYVKSNSHELLSSDEQIPQIQSKPVLKLKSPMGIKSKSIHNLLTVKSSTKSAESHSAASSYDQPSVVRNPPLSSHTFKMPAPKSVVTMRQRADASQPRKLSLIRPSSGYYGYNSKRTDSDTDLGRFSSNNSLSSGSSKSSLSRGDTPESFPTSAENANATFVQPPVKLTNVPSRPSVTNMASGIAPPKVSLLRQPNQIRRSALPRPSMTLTKR